MRVLMIGTGEYTVGSQSASGTDKSLGVVALTMLDLQRRGIIQGVSMCGTSYDKVVAAHQHLTQNQPYAMDCSMELYPTQDCKIEPYKQAIDSMSKGDAVTIFTPDSTHFKICEYAVLQGLHVMIAKPTVHSVVEHRKLIELAKEHQVLVCTEFHKRFDPLYKHAADTLSEKYGQLSYFQAYMSQPKYQLETFKNWVKKPLDQGGSDISYYLNSHHIDFLLWACKLKPVSVYASGSTGVSGVYDTITLLVKFKNESGCDAQAVFTSSWIAPNGAEVHSQQRWSYLGGKGECQIDQAHRGYSGSVDGSGLKYYNPLFWNYSVGKDGQFQGQDCYGYRSFEVFVQSCLKFTSNDKPRGYDQLAQVDQTLAVTQILEAGRKSLESGHVVHL